MLVESDKIGLERKSYIYALRRASKLCKMYTYGINNGHGRNRYEKLR